MLTDNAQGDLQDPPLLLWFEYYVLYYVVPSRNIDNRCYDGNV